MPLWALVALVAAAAQTARNAAQVSLTATIGTVGATQVRFLFGLPFAILFLGLVMVATGETLPTLTARNLIYTTLGAMAQIGATALMLITMKSQSFSVTTAWLKTEPVIVALAAAAVLRDPLSWSALAAIAVATAGVLVMSVKPAKHPRDWLTPGPALTGLAAATLFGLSAIGFRGGVTGLETGGTLIRSTTTLVLSLTIQTGTLLVWMTLFDRKALAASLTHWRRSLGAGFLGAFASQFWFLGFALTSAANIRTLALAEVIFAQLVARVHFGQKLPLRQGLGMALIVLGVGLLLQSQP
ncbi:EamA family transporter [Tabrizicola oligotrophica]|uniref:EamA family transporter n=1 Tax=Tabrizicola oligotrophica TaxID=2710650 RepID=A0A6M0QTS2_9RHOB|nr:EamA family transporter [Tabrizicola oligotrophica]NEY90870.1 EamA family transporter [Tabrizicola oligotrophica]